MSLPLTPIQGRDCPIVVDEVLEKRLAHIEERAIRLELSRPRIGSGGDKQSLDQVELRVEALLNFLEECHGGLTQKADAGSR